MKEQIQALHDCVGRVSDHELRAMIRALGDLFVTYEVETDKELTKERARIAELDAENAALKKKVSP